MRSPWLRMRRRKLGRLLLWGIPLILLLQLTILILNFALPDEKPTARVRVFKGKYRYTKSFWKSVTPLHGQQSCHWEALVRTSPQRLFDQMSNQWQDSESWDWIKQRLSSRWRQWVEVAETITKDANNRTMLRILVVPGVLRATNMAQQVKIQSGGPIGDLIQWADLIGALFVLGHHVIIVDDFFQAQRWLRYDSVPSSLKPVGCDDPTFDLIYADIISMKVFTESVIDKYRCRFRVVDAYGTQAAYNHPLYAKTHGFTLGTYGGLMLNLQQFFTFYPHTDDNSFLGFVVLPPQSTSTKKVENMALLYGKDPTYFQNSVEYILTLMGHLEVHATVANSSVLPPGVINHGIVSTSQYLKLLQLAKFFVGVGQPLESTGVLEALAHGCVFLNPKFNKSRSELQLQGKPTNRRMSSQVPYLEHHVRPPHVFSVDTDNHTQIRTIISQVRNQQVEPFIPHEFTKVGFLERLHAYVSHQDFCGKKPRWPPIIAMTVHLAPPWTSCSKSCQKLGLVCETSFFRDINQAQSFFRLGIHCNQSEEKADIFLPALTIETDICVSQADAMLFSCAGADKDYARLCPCRDALPQQVALCRQCLP